jgi:nicotinate-nucleotide pyrophosphorylase (carboxylating)
VNWFDEGALYSSIGLFLREDLGRGDITTQTLLTRNVRAKGRFVAGENMVVAGLEAAEEVFITLDPHQQLEAFTADGEEVEAGKVIARTSGFADVMLAGERVALNLLQHLSGVATRTREFVKAVDGTKAKIADTRNTTPGLRMLEKYAVQLGGGVNGRNGLDDGVLINQNHVALAGGVGTAVKSTREKIGHLHKIEVEVTSEREAKDAIDNGADGLAIESDAGSAALINAVRGMSSAASIIVTGGVTVENVRELADAGADLIRVDALTQSVRAMEISFQIQAG